MSPSSSSSSSSASVFTESALSPAEIANNLRDELKRLKRRRQLQPYDAAAPRTPPRMGASPRSPPSSPGSPEPMMDDAAALRAAQGILSGQQQGAVSSSSSCSMMARAAENKPIFTLKQMTMICERMCKVGTVAYY